MTVSELGERGLLARIRARLPMPPGDVVIGIGDDAAVVALDRNTQAVLTTDALIEGVHFDRRFSAPADIGHKALAVNLSDLAAMGAAPRWALLSLALPDGFLVAEVEELVDGLVALAGQHTVALVGGNLTRSPGPVVVDITAVGRVRPRRALIRAGGRPGDELYVSGTIGASAAGLEMLRERTSGVGGRASEVEGRESTCIDRYRRPVPRVRLGTALGGARAARAGMDLSDGLADGLNQIAEASGCGVVVEASALPIDEDAREWWVSSGQDAVVAALAGGDDYELLIAAPVGWRGRLRHVSSRVADPPLTKIGVLTRDARERVLMRDGRKESLPAGFEHW